MFRVRHAIKGSSQSACDRRIGADYRSTQFSLTMSAYHAFIIIIRVAFISLQISCFMRLLMGTTLSNHDYIQRLVEGGTT